MQEEFLHHIWQFQRMDTCPLRTTQGDELQVVKPGSCLKTSGPDFFNAQIIIGNQKWAGNIEIHNKSSDWYLHNHHEDQSYDNVILHVVWENDVDIYRKDNSIIPVLEISNFVSKKALFKYSKLKERKSWINCENNILDVSDFVLKNWQEKLYLERLEKRSEEIQKCLEFSKNDWEAVFFWFLAKNFGLNVNGDSFFQMAKSIPFEIIRKESFDPQNLEALFYGTLTMLESYEDTYGRDLYIRWEYLKQKYNLKDHLVAKVEYYKLRPDNFPTIRLSQLAQLYAKHQNLFSKSIALSSTNDFYELFDVGVEKYWETHYQFDRLSVCKKKLLSKSFIDLLMINTIVPFKFLYDRSFGKETFEDSIKILEEIKPEKNVIVDKFIAIGVKSDNAFQSQALIELKKKYCDLGKCLTCSIGIELLKK
ncbi:DUF2851 family protein [Flavobacterium terrae]|uniref:DUF2851 domain-containing protein n=1 Tax=Flavobacterium terrae TaxID=415425 RepID=A0A1M6DHQ6_9FLAO|nr:DUF2851 family protein [Flavobacterium terrae]SHI72816.1 Protein of unknown function [Flavobacterium terrae]